jgi:hypothetical protein
MYCPSCGSEQIQGLKYCNRCGFNLTPSPNVSPAKLGGMIWAVSIATALVSLGGLIMIFIFAMEYMSRGDASGRSLVFLIFFLLVILTISALLIRQLSRLLNVYLQTSDVTKPKPAKLDEPQVAQLSGPQEPMMDVAEQTTRRLEPSPGEQKRY